MKVSRMPIKKKEIEEIVNAGTNCAYIQLLKMVYDWIHSNTTLTTKGELKIDVDALREYLDTVIENIKIARIE